jgi:hypothetical protein
MRSGPFGRSRIQSPGSLRYAQTFGLNIPTLLLRHSLPALVALPSEAMLRIALLPAPNRHIPPER